MKERVVNWHFMILKESNCAGWLVQVKWNKTWRLNNLFRSLNVSKMQTSVFLGKHMRKQRPGLGGQQQSISNGLPGYLVFAVESPHSKPRQEEPYRLFSTDKNEYLRPGQSFQCSHQPVSLGPKRGFFQFWMRFIWYTSQVSNVFNLSCGCQKVDNPTKRWAMELGKTS